MNLALFLTSAAERDPAKPAFVYGDRSISYGEADERTNAIASALRELQFRPGDRAGLMMWNCPELLETMFAVWKAGGSVVPMNARFGVNELTYHLHDSGAKILFFGEKFADMVEEVRKDVPTVRHFVCASETVRADQLAYDILVERHLGEPLSPVDGVDDSNAWLFYTSGTTGRPKGAMLSHRILTFVSVAWLADLMQLQEVDVGLHAAPLTHGAGFHALALTLKGCTQVILKPHSFHPENVFKAIEDHGITNTWLVPTQIKMLLRSPQLSLADTSSLKWIVYGGAPMYVEDLREALRIFGPIFVQLFGQGESPMTGTYLSREDHILEGSLDERLQSCGRARSGIEIQIRDEGAEEVPRGDVGEICIRGPSVMSGYWRRPEETAEVLRGGWLQTGDIGYMDAHGYVYILDRNKDMIISGGANIYPREIEEILVKHPDVDESCVIGVFDELWGEAVKALVVKRPGARVTEEQLVGFVRDHLADYKKPRTVEFIESIPKNAYGKVVKQELRAQYEIPNTGSAPR